MNHRRIRLAGAGAAVLAALSTCLLGAGAAAAAGSGGRQVTSVIDFGPACSSVPASGAGSFSGMTKAPVALAASHNPVLSTLVAAVEKAGLVDTLDNAKGLTVFAPDNAAFSAVPRASLQRILSDRAELTKLLEYHVIAGRLGPAALVGVHKTIEGATVSVAGSGTHFDVNGTSAVVCGNVQTANATVYIVSRVLTP